MNQVLEQFLAAVQATALDHTIAFEETKRYWHIVKNCVGMRSVYCFVRKEDGPSFLWPITFCRGKVSPGAALTTTNPLCWRSMG